MLLNKSKLLGNDLGKDFQMDDSEWEELLLAYENHDWVKFNQIIAAKLERTGANKGLSYVKEYGSGNNKVTVISDKDGNEFYL